MQSARTRRVVGVLLAGGLLLVAASARAEEGTAGEVTGEVIDMSCYLAHPNTSTGNSHRKCAETCAKKGLPMGLLTEDKQVYLLLEDHENPKVYATALENAAKTITVEGRKVSQGGVNGIVVESVK